MKRGCMSKLLAGAAILGILLLLALVFKSAPPKGQTGPEADLLAQKMMAAVDCEAWEATDWVSWSFAGAHHYIWDKKRNLLQAEWGKTKVLLRLDTQQGIAYKNGSLLNGKKADKACKKAWSYFCNDSFWLNPVCKAFDPGTERYTVDLKTGGQGVAVTYTSGGVTPGDTYVWELGEDFKPKRWRMWVKIIPVGGVPTDWGAWRKIPGGAWIAGQRKLGPIDLKLDQVNAAVSWEELGIDTDPFSPLQSSL